VDGRSRACFQSNAWGTCTGVETCAPTQGWSACTAAVPAAEQCNGRDDDCDGVVDDGVVPPTQPCVNANAAGVCVGSWVCRAGGSGAVAWQCTAPVPAPEACDYRDNDCDGDTDEDFRDATGEYFRVDNCGVCGYSCVGLIEHATMTCDTARATPACVVGGCAPGYYQQGDFACLPVTTDTCRVCETDANCPVPGDRCLDLDGGRFCGYDCAAGNRHGTPAGVCPEGYACVTDPQNAAIRQCRPLSGSCSCLAGDAGRTRTCVRSNASGTCYGTETCQPASGWGTCTARVPALEVCNGVDDDCNGFEDDVSGRGAACQVTATLPDGVHSCAGVRVCQTGSTALVCNAPTPTVERCNYRDDDCDGQTDEAFPTLYQSCSAGVGACQRYGFVDCLADGSGSRCNATAGPQTTEVCNGVDDDCDGATDEGWPGKGDVCTVGVGVCQRSGVKICDPASPSGPLTCSVQPGTPGTEICNDLDDNCAGGTDELWPTKGQACTAGLGICARNGVLVCNPANRAGPVICNATPGPANPAETCDYQDDDCDGTTDEGFLVSGKYRAVAHCGACGNDCHQYWVPDAATHHATPRCDAGGTTPFCAFDCEAQYVDADGVPDNGCELFADPAAIFVSVPTADNGAADVAACGAWNQPCATITYGLQRAAGTAGKTKVLVSGGAYEENLTLREGIALLGGYNPSNWRRDPEVNVTSVFGTTSGSGHVTTVLAQNIRTTTTLLEGFTIHGRVATDPGANSYALRVVDCNQRLVVRNNQLVGGYAGPGRDGTAGADGTSGTAGAAGLSPFDTGLMDCTTTTRAGGAGGAQTCGGTVVSGGAGGDARCPVLRAELPSQREPDGAPGPNGGGAGGAGAYSSEISTYCGLCFTPNYYPPGDPPPPPQALPTSGGDGRSGSRGADGSGGAACSAVAGSVVSGDWAGSGATAGGGGQAGRGGGGGGTGGGVDKAYTAGQCPTRGGDTLGATGGGGGAGACGAAGGQGGGAGGGAFALFVHFSAPPASLPVVEANVIRRGTGGPGGRGGAGGRGGVGGDGGAGGPEGAGISDQVWCAGAAGRGGRGGDGGHGGGGGGGCGGVSYGIFVAGQGGLAPTWRLTNTFRTTGQAGPGGAGGSAVQPTLRGSDGPGGAAADANF
jgi:hypothetical protein